MAIRAFPAYLNHVDTIVPEMGVSGRRVVRTLPYDFAHRPAKTLESIRARSVDIIWLLIDFTLQGHAFSGHILSDHDIGHKPSGGNPIHSEQSYLSPDPALE